MSRRSGSSKKGAARPSPDAALPGSDDEFVVVTPKGAAAAVASAKAKLQPPLTRVEQMSAQLDQNRTKGTPEEEAEYESKRERAYRAELLGVDVPPIAPPGHVLIQDVEVEKLTFWKALFRRAENRPALQQLYAATVLMVCVPLGLMGFAYFVALPTFVSNAESRLMWAGFAGVLGVNIVALGFGLFAYYEKNDDDEEEDGSISGDSAVAMEEKRRRWAAWEKEQEAQESREDQERLHQLRKLRGEEGESSKEEDDKAATVTKGADATAQERSSSTKSKLRRRSSSAAAADKADSAVGEDADEAEPAAAATPSRTVRSRSRKA